MNDRLIELLREIRPNFGDIGSRDVDVRKKQEQIDEAIALLADGGKGEAVEGYAFRCDGRLWVVTDPDVAMRWQSQGFEVVPVDAPQAECAPREAQPVIPEEVRQALTHAAGGWRGAACDTRDDAEGERRSADYNRRAQIIEDWIAAPTPERADADTAGAWQPIETAPKDGSTILVWRTHATRPHIAKWDAVYSEYEGIDSGDHIYGISHWMPIITPAAGASERADAAPTPSDSAITACALVIKGVCMTKPQDEWTAQIEKRIRFMLKGAGK